MEKVYVDFSFKKEWYEKIKNGEKNVEYREAKGYWSTRLWHEGCYPTKEREWNYESIRHFSFPISCYSQLGYDPKTRLEATVIKVQIVDGINTDLKIDKPVYAIHFRLGDL